MGPELEGRSSISGGSMLLLAGMPGGTGTSDGTGTSARFNSPRGIVAYGDTLFVSDQNNHTIRMIDTLAGMVTTLAGSPGLSGVDDGIGLRARFRAPEGIETDGTYLYIADTQNHAIRKLEINTGVVVTLAGRRGQYGSKDGAGKDALFRGPTAITILGDFLYVADTDNHTIRRVDKASGETVTLAGLPSRKGSEDGIGQSARFNFPLGLISDGTLLYIADTYNHTIRILDPVTGVVSTLAGNTGVGDFADGSIEEALFHYPFGLTNKGTELFVADLWNEAIRVLDLSSFTVHTIAGTPPEAGSADGLPGIGRFYSPVDVTVAGDYLYVADMNNHSIRSVDIITGEISTFAGQPPHPGTVDETGEMSRFSTPGGLIKDGDNLYVADTFNHTIRKIDLSTGEVTTLAGTPGVAGTTDSTESPAIFNFPTDVIADGNGENIYIVDRNNHVIRRMNLSTGEVRTFVGYPNIPGNQNGVGTDARFRSPRRGVRLGDMLYIADTGNHVIRQVDISMGEVTTLAGENGLAGWTDTGEGISGVARFNSPGDIATDGAFLYVADTGNHAIRKVVIPTGVVETIAGSRGSAGLLDSIEGSPLFKSPEGIVWNNGILYVADTGNNVIRKIDLSTKKVSLLAGDISCVEETETVSEEETGTVTVINKKCEGQPSGTSVYGDSADSTGKTTSFNGPTGINTDGTYLYVMDSGSNRIRRVTMEAQKILMFQLTVDDGLGQTTDTVNITVRTSPFTVDDSLVQPTDTDSPTVQNTVGATLNDPPLAVAGEDQTVDEFEVVTLDGSGSSDPNEDTITYSWIQTGGPEVTLSDTTAVNPTFISPLVAGETKSFSYSKNKGIGLNTPTGGDLVGGNLLYLADSGNHIVRLLDITDLSGAPLTVLAGNVGISGYGYSLRYAARFNRPVGIAADGMGNLYVSDTGNHTIRKVVVSEREVTTIAGTPGKAGFMNSEFGSPKFNYPRGICIVGSHIYVADAGNHLIRRVNLSTGYVGLVAGLGDIRTRTGSPGTADSTGAAAGFNNPRGITSDGTYLYVTDTSNHTIRRILRTTGQVKTIAGMPGVIGYMDRVGFDARFYSPKGIAVDGDYLYVADTGNNILRRVNKYTGEVLTLSGKSGQASLVTGEREEARYNNVVSLATDSYSPYLFFTDSEENVVGKVEK